MGRVCEHGSLAHKCETCDLAEAERRVAELEQAIRDHREVIRTSHTKPYADADERLWTVLDEGVSDAGS